MTVAVFCLLIAAVFPLSALCDVTTDRIIHEGRVSLENLHKQMRLTRFIQEELAEHKTKNPDTYLDIQEPLESVPPFDCIPAESPSVPTPPTSVHELRPSDFKVVAALGDDITVGVALGDVHVVIDILPNRGEAWSIGGDYSYNRNVLTIPNILHEFGTDVKGHSSCLSTVNSRHAGFNLARPAGFSADLLNQANMFLDRLFNDSRVDPQNDWKLLTILIGANDLCKSCQDYDGEFKREAYRQNIEAALDLLYERVPRMFINLVIQFPLTLFSNVSDNAICNQTLTEFCYCGKDWSKHEEVRATQLAYAEEITNLIGSGKYDGRQDFAVVIQPHMRDMVSPPINETTGDIDRSYFAVDCLHFSRKGQMALAYMLWNTMLTPVGHKTYNYDFNEASKKLRCPTDKHKYIFTGKNSGDVEWP